MSSTATKAPRIERRGGKDYVVTPTSCAVCKQCWMFPNGVCLYEGPYAGYQRVDYNEQPIDDVPSEARSPVGEGS